MPGQYIQLVSKYSTFNKYKLYISGNSIFNGFLKGKYEVATNYSKKAFDISRQINQREATEQNRVLFGISRAHKMLSHFNENVELGTRKTIHNLIKWRYESPENCEKILIEKS